MRQDMFRTITKAGNAGRFHPYQHRVPQLIGEDAEPVELGRIPIRPRDPHWKYRDPSVRIAPLNRFLACRVGRPWAEVYAEADSHFVYALQRTVRDWLAQYVCQNVYKNAEGELVFNTPYSGVREVTYNDYYVDPDTRLLCSSRDTFESSRAKRKARQAQLAKEREKDRVIASSDLQYHRKDGVWYEVRLCQYLGLRTYGERLPIDTFRKSVINGNASYALYGNRELFAESHRVLSHKELKRLNLV